MSDVRLPPVRILPAADPRVETGPIAFGSDWPGTFIRGDNAAFYAAHLRTVLFGDNKQPEYFFSRQVIYGLLSDLESSNLTTRSDDPLTVVLHQPSSEKSIMEDTSDPSRNPVQGHIELGNGYTLFWRTDAAIGCREYTSDEIGGGVFVWNTALVSDTALLAAILQERMLCLVEHHQRKSSDATPDEGGS